MLARLANHLPSDHLDGEPRPRTLVPPPVVTRDPCCERISGGVRCDRCFAPSLHPGTCARIVVLCGSIVMGSNDGQRTLFEEMVDCVDKKLPKIGLTRWFENVVVVHEYLQISTVRFAVCMYAALQLGLFVEGAGAVARKFIAHSQDQDFEMGSTQMDGGGAQVEAIGQEHLRIRVSTAVRPQRLENQADRDRDCAICASLATRNEHNCSLCTGDNYAVCWEGLRFGTASHQRAPRICSLDWAARRRRRTPTRCHCPSSNPLLRRTTVWE